MGVGLATASHRWWLLSTASELGVGPRFRPAGLRRARRWQPRGGGDDLHAGFDFETTLGGETLYSFLGTVGVKAPGSVLPERVTLGENLNVQAQPRASKKTPGVGSR
jgi:hypothetical protein